MFVFCFPIFGVGSSPISSNFSLLIPNFSAKDSIVSLCVIFDTSTPTVWSFFNIFINSCTVSFSCFSKLIPILSNSSTCSSVGGLQSPCPLYAWAIWYFCIPIFNVGSSPISPNFSLLIPDFFANVSVVSFCVIFDTSTPTVWSFLNIFINSSIFIILIAPQLLTLILVTCSYSIQ